MIDPHVAAERAQGTSEDERDGIIADLINCWDVFYTFLPDGEYRGLAQMRAACNQHRARASSLLKGAIK